jgi:hypothetical protein
MAINGRRRIPVVREGARRASTTERQSFFVVVVVVVVVEENVRRGVVQLPSAVTAA